MSDKSYQIKENNQVMIQGGEKKVMKKILSVALSTAMAFSMFASVAFGDDALTSQQKFDILKEEGIFTGYPDGTAGLDKEMTRGEFAKVLVELLGLEPIQNKASFNDKNYAAGKWPAPYVEAVYAAGIMEGKNTTKMIFDFNGNITVQEMAKVLVTVQNLEIPSETNNNASNWAKGYVQAAINAGLINSSVNPLANANRTQLVEVAYAIYLAQNKPKVASYDVQEDGKVVEFTLANSEKVKVTLETPLKANVATEVKFTYNNYEYTESVTWVVTVATKVDSVSASNLKEVVVAFDGTVDKASAGNKNNYSVKGNLAIEKATVSEDQRSVKLLLAQGEAATLTNQTETEITLKNVKNSDGSKVFDQTVKFTPVDVAIPEITEVVGLGTGAVKLVFSEPVRESGVIVSNNYRLNGNVIGANVTFQYPNVAIVETGLTVGEHKITVSNVEDYSGLKVTPVEKTFTVVEDTEAPTVAAITTNDLTEVTIEFDETVKSVGRIYANSTNNTATGTPKIEDNKVTVTFPSPLNVSENTIYIENVRDYSNNTANREGKVTPVLDTVRPEVVRTELKVQDNGNHQLVVEFSEKLDSVTAQTRANYTLKDQDGKAAKATGLDNNGHPVLAPVYTASNNSVTIDLAGKLANGTYTLEVSGVRDMAYVPNQMLPYTTTINANVASTGEVTRVWSKDANAQTAYIFIQFNKNLATSGAGDATTKAKYTVSTDGTNYRTLKNDESVILYAPDTIRLTVEGSHADYKNVGINLVADTAGNYFAKNGSYNFTEQVGSEIIGLKSAPVAIDKKTVELEFDGPLSTVYVSDFRVGTQTPTSYTLNADRTKLQLKLNNELPSDVAGIELSTGANPATRDNLGVRIQQIPATLVVDKIAPEVDSWAVTATNATYTDLTFTATEAVNINSANVTDAFVRSLFTVKVNETEVDVTNVSFDGSNNFTVRVARSLVADDIIAVTFNGTANANSKAVVDLSTDKNALANFQDVKVY